MKLTTAQNRIKKLGGNENTLVLGSKRLTILTKTVTTGL